MPEPQAISIFQGMDTSVTLSIYPPQSVAGWTFEWRGKSSDVNPPSTNTLLIEDVTSSATQIQVDQKIKPFPKRTPFRVRMDDEVLWVSKAYDYYKNSAYNFLWEVERGVHGTSPAAHVKGCRIELFTVPQMLLDNGSLGGISVEDEDLGILRLTFSAELTMQRPIGTYFWVLRKTNQGSQRPVAQGTLYLIPSSQTALQEPLP